jgi:XTP/dITP diphosphohydrolase
MEIFVATNNMHKVKELSAILGGVSLKLPSDAGIQFYHDETGTTYLENALGKALTLYRQVGKPVLADDSGLSVPALGGAPGVYSARYGDQDGKPPLDDAGRNQRLLEAMETLQSPEERSAFFVCSMVLVLEEYRIFTVQETFAGSIALQPAGSGGFGYDPLFYLAEYGKSVAELPEEEKNSISHRGRAGKRMAALIASLKE